MAWPRNKPKWTLDEGFAHYAETPDSCWRWRGALNGGGYGQWIERGRRYYAHRGAWKRANGRAVPAGMFICHHCDNPSCFNPKHLYAGTYADDGRDVSVRRRYLAARNPELASEIGRRANALIKSRPIGERNGGAKLTNEQVVAILADRRDAEAVAIHYGVSKSSIENIRNGTTWGFLTGIEHKPRDQYCPNGHKRTPENTRLQKNGWRVCRICQSATMRRWRERQASNGATP